VPESARGEKDTAPQGRPYAVDVQQAKDRGQARADHRYSG
jgi:hypothetical protein